MEPLNPATHVQSLGSLLPDGDDAQYRHVRHVLGAVAPEVVEYVPLSQRAQDAEPGELLYVPAVQLVQDPPVEPLDPMLHVQSLGAWLPDGDDDREGQLEHVLDVVAPEIVEYVPPAQRAQEAEPGEILYVPAVQLVQDPPLAPEKPALHLQSDNSLLAAGASELVGHIKH